MLSEFGSEIGPEITVITFVDTGAGVNLRLQNVFSDLIQGVAPKRAEPALEHFRGGRGFVSLGVSVKMLLGHSKIVALRTGIFLPAILVLISNVSVQL